MALLVVMISVPDPVRLADAKKIMTHHKNHEDLRSNPPAAGTSGSCLA